MSDEMRAQPRDAGHIWVKLVSGTAMLLSCATSNVLADSSGRLVSVERRGYSGTCPTYDLQVFPDGRVTYRGYANVSSKGEHEKQLPSHVVADIAAAIDTSRLQRISQGFVPSRTWRVVVDCKKDADKVAKDPRYAELCKTRDKLEMTVGIRAGDNEDKISFRTDTLFVVVQLSKTAPTDRPRVQSLFRRVEELTDAAKWAGREPCE